MGRFGSTATGAATGAGAGAIAGSVVPGIGTAAGAVGGAIIGGIGGYFAGGGGYNGAGMKAYKVDPQHGYGGYQYGGQDFDPASGELSGAEKRAGYYDSLGSYYGNREDTAADYTDANADYARQQQARERQMALGQQYQDVINGTGGPSLAELQMRAGQDATAQSALNMAASARGGGGLLAQQQAINANALGQANVNQQAGMLRAQETAQARDAYGNLLNNVRGGDMSAMGQRADMAQAQAGIGLQSQQQRYAQAFGYRSQADALRNDQRDANIQIAQGNQNAATAAQTGAAQAAASTRAAQYGAAAGLVGGALGAGATMYTGGGKKA